MQRPPGRRVVDGAGQERLAQDDARERRVPQGTDAREIGDAARHEDVGVDGRDDRWTAAPVPAGRRRVTGRIVAHQGPRAVRRGFRAWAARGAPGPPRHGNAASRSGRGSRPTASQSPATATQSRTSCGWSATLIASTTRVAPAANARRIWSAPSRPPASWIGIATRAATRPTASRFAGAPARAPSKSTRWISRAPWPTKRSAITSGRSVGAPTPAAAPGHDTTRDRPSRGRSRGHEHGVYAVRVGQQPFGPQKPPVEADRQGAVHGAACRGSAQRERVAQPPLLVARAAAAAGPCPAGTRAGTSACRCSG